MKRCDLKAIRTRAKAAIFDEVQVSTALATAEIRAEIIAGMKASVSAWETDPPADMFIARLGRWCIRIAHDWREVDGDARGILEWLRRAEQSRADVPAMADEIDVLREGVRSALGGLVLYAADKPDDSTDLQEVMRILRAQLPPEET